MLKVPTAVLSTADIEHRRRKQAHHCSLLLNAWKKFWWLHLHLRESPASWDLPLAFCYTRSDFQLALMAGVSRVYHHEMLHCFQPIHIQYTQGNLHIMLHPFSTRVQYSIKRIGAHLWVLCTRIFLWDNTRWVNQFAHLPACFSRTAVYPVWFQQGLGIDSKNYTFSTTFICAHSFLCLTRSYTCLCLPDIT